jgi:hypothetical protein
VIYGAKRPLARDTYSLRDGAREGVPILQTKRGRKLIRTQRHGGLRSLRITLQLVDAGRPTPIGLTRRLRLR